MGKGRDERGFQERGGRKAEGLSEEEREVRRGREAAAKEGEKRKEKEKPPKYYDVDQTLKFWGSFTHSHSLIRTVYSNMPLIGIYCRCADENL